ncbi:MAG: hypothetical protein Nkreftii_001850 [Candidatus Nitrospira kreftii]|mgnify:CR=1 FL=1|uniref:Uncharacterized protein n=1 Tax=Candidatus Nitrospira kreftii TaxID=2652173 RepID=A0A7S8FE15_9BACT|nr:MAG: hypothetical protein Nkreftii_001850 [Candidatus Nitrospira kreftii]
MVRTYARKHPTTATGEQMQNTGLVPSIVYYEIRIGNSQPSALDMCDTLTFSSPEHL